MLWDGAQHNTWRGREPPRQTLDLWGRIGAGDAGLSSVVTVPPFPAVPVAPDTAQEELSISKVWRPQGGGQASRAARKHLPKPGTDGNFPDQLGQVVLGEWYQNPKLAKGPDPAAARAC